MADHDSMNASEAAGKMLSSAHADVLREAVRLMLIEIMEGEVAELAGGERYERSAERLTRRNGYRQRRWDTRVGSLELAIPRLRSGSRPDDPDDDQELHHGGGLDPQPFELLLVPRLPSQLASAALWSEGGARSRSKGRRRPLRGRCSAGETSGGRRVGPVPCEASCRVRRRGSAGRP